MEPMLESDDDAANRCVYIVHICDYPRQIASVSDRKIYAGGGRRSQDPTPPPDLVLKFPPPRPTRVGPAVEGGAEFPGIHAARDLAASQPATNSIDHPPVTDAELKAWLWFDWSSSVYVHVGIGGFLRLLVQTICAKKAGFPLICLNVVQDEPERVRAMFPGHDWGDGTPVMYRIVERLRAASPSCENSRLTDPACVGDYCWGLPPNFGRCLDQAGEKPLRFGISGQGEDGSWMPSTLTVFMVSMTSLAQILVFALVTPLADYGDLRKRMMTFSTVLGSVATACMAFVSADTYWVGCFLLLFSNVMFSISQVAMYAYLPVLLKVRCVSLLFQAFRMP